MKQLFSWCCLAVLFSAVVYGQGDLATVTGLVTDSTQAAVAGVRVVIRNTDTNITRTISTNQVGLFTITQLPPGPYELVASQSGFETYRQSRIVLETGQQLRSDISLKIGSTTETIEVKAEVAPLNTEDGAIKGAVVVQQEMQDVPLDGRDATDIALLVPGVLPNAEGASGSSMSVNGARADNTNFYVDGFNNRNARTAGIQLLPNIDGLQEFKMETSGFSAKYGAMAGGVMKMVLKSGTNRLHGALFEYIRNTRLDARGFFDPETLPLHRNQFGATLNGPVVFPKLYDGHDKTFFLFSYEGYRNAEGQTRLANVPTALERGGDFSQARKSNGALVSIRNPFANNAPFPGGVIPASMFNPIALKITKWYPLSNYVGVGLNYQATASYYNKWDGILGKLDHRFNDKDTISIRYGHRANGSPNLWAGSNLGEFPSVAQADTSMGGVTWMHLFSPHLINEARGGFSRSAGGNHLDTSLGQPTAAQLGMAGSTTDPMLAGFPQVTLSNYETVGYDNGSPTRYHVTDYQIGDDLTWITGKHVLTFGVGVSMLQFNMPKFNNSRGIAGTSGVWTGAGTAANGDSYADLLLGLLNSSSITASPAQSYIRSRNYGGYVNDDFKIRPNLTLNLGLRYEIDQPIHDKYDRIMNFIPSIGKIIVASDKNIPNYNQLLQQAGLTAMVGTASQYGLPHSLIYPDYNNFAPRFGFAWRGPRRVVLRGGYGWFYSGTILENMRTGLNATFPFAATYQFSRAASNPNYLTLENPWPLSLGGGSLSGTNTSAGYQLHAPVAYMQNYNLTIEHDIGRGDVLEIGYLGSKGTHLARAYDVNQPYRTMANYMAGGAFPMPYPALSTISYWDFGSNSIYNAGQIMFRRRGTGGFFYRLAYTYSKSIDNASQFGTGASTGGYGGAIAARNLRLERARSDFDRGHVFTAIFNYILPVGHGKLLLPNRGRIVNGIFGGWQLAATITAATGQAFTVKDSSTNAGIGESDRPNRIASGKDITGNGRRGLDYPWFDPAAFVPTPGCASRTNCAPDQYGFLPFAPGNSGRNILDGPGMFYTNGNLMKNFHLGERRSIQARCEVFNVFNKPNFKLPNRNFNQTAAGMISDVQGVGRGGPRTIQFALKYIF